MSLARDQMRLALALVANLYGNLKRQLECCLENSDMQFACEIASGAGERIFCIIVEFCSVTFQVIATSHGMSRNMRGRNGTQIMVFGDR